VTNPVRSLSTSRTYSRSSKILGSISRVLSLENGSSRAHQSYFR